MNRLPFRRRLLKGVLKIIAGVLSIIITLMVFGTILNWRMKRSVGPEIPPGFPVVVFWPGTGGIPFSSKVSPAEEIPQLRAQHPGLSFLMPNGGERELSRQIRLQAEGIDTDIRGQYKTGRRMLIGAQIQNAGIDYQDWRIRFQHGNDHVNVSYYRARQNSFEPKFLERYFGPGQALNGCPFILLFCGLGIWLSNKLINRIRYFNPNHFTPPTA